MILVDNNGNKYFYVSPLQAKIIETMKENYDELDDRLKILEGA